MGLLPLEKLYEIKVVKSFGSRKSRNTFSNTHIIAVTAALADPGANVVVNAIVDAEKSSSLSSVHFLRATMRQLGDNPLNKPSDDYRAFPLSGVGARNVPVAEIVGGAAVLVNQTLPPDICVRLDKKVGLNRGGFLDYRGMLKDGDVIVGLDKQWELTADARAGLEAGVVAGLNALCMESDPTGPYAMKGEHNLIVTNAIRVLAVTLGGVQMRQERVQKVSLVSAQEALFKRELNSAYNTAWTLMDGAPVAGAIGAKAVVIAQLCAALLQLWNSLPPEVRAKIVKDTVAALRIAYLAFLAA